VKERMKGILLKIDDGIFDRWKQEIIVKKVCGNFDAQSLSDAVPALIIVAIEDGKTEITITPKK